MEWMPVHMYYVYTGKSTAELEVIKELKPQRLLISYYYFKNRSMKDFISSIGYKPDIMLDSGAWSAYTSGKAIYLDKYMRYLTANESYIKHYMSLDVIGDGAATYEKYLIMRQRGYRPIPVFHFSDDVSLLKQYVSMGEQYIALGGTVPVKSKFKVAHWINTILLEHPEIKFHVLGSSSNRIIDNCNVYSCDSTTWFMSAINGHVPHIPGYSREDKIRRATFLMQRSLQDSKFA